jgi:aspartate 1-decarboxylase
MKFAIRPHQNQGRISGLAHFHDGGLNMFVEMLQAKIHRAVVTDANLNYVGSITIDEALLNAAGILPNQKVQILNINTGARFETYVIVGERNSGIITLNGAAARLTQPQDIIIIITYAWMDAQEAINHQPKVVLVDEKNKILTDHRANMNARREA